MDLLTVIATQIKHEAHCHRGDLFGLKVTVTVGMPLDAYRIPQFVKLLFDHGIAFVSRVKRRKGIMGAHQLGTYFAKDDLDIDITLFGLC